MNTESKNKRASGAKRRKESAIKKKKVEQFLTEVPKLSVFFRPISASSQNSSENEIACVPLDCTVGEILSTNNDVSLPNSPSSFEQSPDTQELETGRAAHADFSVKPVCSSVDLQITDETSTLTLFSEDPANWDRENENLIEHLILNPPKSNSNLICRSSSSTSSKFGNVDDTEKRERFVSKEVFYRRLVNGEKQLRDWLVFSQKNQSLYCFPCFFFGNTKSNLGQKTGFNSWKNQHQCMKEHEQSTDHRFAVTSLVNRSGTKSRIDAEFVKEFLNEREYWRSLLKRIVSVIKFLSSRGLAFRGSNQTLGSPQNGNYLGALELLSEYDAFLAKHLQTHGNKGKGKTSYLSANICEEFVELLAKSVLEFMVAELKQAKYYSTILDSTPDISHVDQLTFVIRYVLEDGTPVERFFGFFPISGHTATEMETFLLEQLEKHDIKIEDCRGQSYDNASNMSGQYNGLQAKIKKRNPLAEYVPCAGHSLNLIGSSAAEACSASLDFFGFLQSIYNFFAASTHRWAILKKYLKKDLRVPKSLSQTRWSARADACIALKEGYKAFQAALNEIAADRCQPPSARNEASGLASKFDQLEIGVLTVVWSVVMERFNKTNKLLQTVNIDLGTVVDLYTSLTNFVQEVRSNFTKYETEAKLMSTEVYEADKRRKRTRKRHHDEIESSVDTEFTGQSKMRANINEILDQLISETNRRKESYTAILSKFAFISGLSKFNTEELTAAAENFMTRFPNDVDSSLVSECLHFRSFIPIIAKGRSEKMHAASEEITAFEILQFIQTRKLKSVFPNIAVGVRMFLSTAAANVSGERSFNVLKRVKNAFRSTMLQARLSSLSLLQIENSIFQKINSDQIIDQFCSSKIRRKC